MDTPTEEWRASPLGPPHVEVSNLGRVRTADRIAVSVRDGAPNAQRKAGKVLSPWLGANGYLAVSIKVGASRPKYYVHRLVAAAFCSGFDASLSVNHISGLKTDNRPENLEWVTLSRNTEHQWEIGHANLRGDAHPSRKLSSVQVREARRLLAKGASCASIARLLGVSDSLVGKIRDRQRWASVP